MPGKKKGCILAPEQVAGVRSREFHSSFGLHTTPDNQRTAYGGLPKVVLASSNEPRWPVCGTPYLLTVCVLDCARTWAARHADVQHPCQLRLCGRFSGKPETLSTRVREACASTSPQATADQRPQFHSRAPAPRVEMAVLAAYGPPVIW